MRRSALMRGIRSRPTTSPGPTASVAGAPGTMQDDHWRRNFALLEKHGMSWDMRIPYWHLEEGAEVARSFPGIPMVVNHTGLPLDRSEEGLAIWRKGLAALADCPNVVIKLSELGLPHGTWDVPSNIRVVREAAAIFGPDRIIFASNLPVASLSTTFGGIVDVMRAGAGQGNAGDARQVLCGERHPLLSHAHSIAVRSGQSHNKRLGGQLCSID